MNGGDRPVPLNEISERQDISLSYLEQIFNTMKRAGLVDSKPGAGGGYRLAREPEKITAGDVMRVVEGPMRPVDCGRGSCRIKCDRDGKCATQVLWNNLGSKIEEFLDSVTIKDLMETSNRPGRNNISLLEMF